MTERVEELRDLLSGADADLAQQDLRALLDRIRRILAADTAAILLREPGSTDLTARVACGIEDEVRHGMRVPIGSGFAGQVALAREPVTLNRVDATTVANPLLWQRGVRTMLGKALVVEDDLIGVLHVGRLTDVGFDTEDAQLLESSAERIAGAIHVRRLGEEAAAAERLARGLLPPRLPVLPEIQFAARYVPAENRSIGGDWYDAFLLPDRTLGLVMGDVAGHGLRAAVIMGRVKSALRAYALLGEGPDRVLELTDRKVQHFEIGKMVTLLYATSSPPYDEFTICSAGHLPPVLATPNHSSELVKLPVGPPLGVVDSVKRECTVVPTPVGSSLVLYTDGLIERRSEPLDEGLEKLRAAVRPTAAETVCREVMQHVVGSNPLGDDAAVLALHRIPEPPDA